ncbi:MAG: hypothetical protein JRH10_12940 [Deltaproteobacteria bacterium]|nr:hypothetical protein [Deltaproteobacteria bacterium]MBW2446801.1 hypothetical protein [Deltaproteobacteria bacterium]
MKSDARRAMRWWIGLVVLLGLWVAPANVSASGASRPGDPAARLLGAEHASDVWDLTVALDDGHWVIAQVTISNVGPGDRTGAIVGHVLAPDGTSHEFHKVRTQGGWTLSPDRRRIDLDSIIFDQRGAPKDPARFYVGKKRVHLDLFVDLSGDRVASAGLAGGVYGLDLLALAAPVRGTLQLGEDAPTRSVTGRAILTHRWMDSLESRWVERRVEFFGLENGTGVYLSDVTAPDGEAHRWLVVGRDGRIVESTEQVELDPVGAGGLAIRAASATGRVGASRELLRDEPLARAPWLARLFVGRLTRPRFIWSSAPFDFTVGRPEAGGSSLAGRGLLGVSRFDATGFDATDQAPARPSDLWSVR